MRENNSMNLFALIFADIFLSCHKDIDYAHVHSP